MKILVTICILISGMTLNAQTSILGTWNTGKENTIIEITEEDGVCSATFISSDNAKLKIGSQFLKDVKAVKAEWKGKLYSVKKKKWYDVTLKEKGDILEAKVKAGLMKKTLEWKRE